MLAWPSNVWAFLYFLSTIGLPSARTEMMERSLIGDQSSFPYLLLSHPLFSYLSLSYSLFHEYCSGGVADADLPGDGHGEGGGGHSADGGANLLSPSFTFTLTQRHSYDI